MPKTANFAIGSVAALAVLVGASLYFGLSDRRSAADCGGAGIAGGNSQIGGPFRLVDGSGAEVADTTVLAKPSLIYFGYTFCPDVCPFDVARNAAAVDQLAESGLEVTPVFITVDPERDTPEVVADYAEAFHPSMVGLTGTIEQVEAAAKEFKVYSRKQDSEDEYYLVDHSTFTYLSIPGQGVVDYFNRSDTADLIAGRTACQIEALG